MAMMSMVAFDGENAPPGICKNSEVRFASPSELSKLYYSLVIKIKKKGRETKKMFLTLFLIHKKLYH